MNAMQAVCEWWSRIPRCEYYRVATEGVEVAYVERLLCALRLSNWSTVEGAEMLASRVPLRNEPTLGFGTVCDVLTTGRWRTTGKLVLWNGLARNESRLKGYILGLDD